MDRQSVRSLVPLVHVANLRVSLAFYEKLGFGVCNSFTPPGAEGPVWVYLASCSAQLMLNLADAPVVAEQQAVLFYVYCEDVAAMHAQLGEAGLDVGPVNTPFYNPKGEFRLIDPDGYVVMVAHL